MLGFKHWRMLMQTIIIEQYELRHGQVKYDITIDDDVFENLDVVTMLFYLMDFLNERVE